MNNPISFSVIIPSLNQGVFIQPAIDSVLNQTYPPKEVIVIDGGSDDGTISILEQYSNRIKWISEPDTGQSNAINKGFKIATGEIISWLNSDDILYSNALETLAVRFEQQPEIDLFYGQCDYIDSQGEFLRPYSTSEPDYKKFIENAHNFIPQPATFFRRKLLSQIGFLNESLHYNMDFEYWIRVGKTSKIAFISQKLAALRLHDKAKSIKDLKYFASELEDIYLDMTQAGDNPHNINFKLAQRNMYYRAAHTAYWGNAIGQSRKFIHKAWILNAYKPSRLLFQILLASLGIHMRLIMENPYEN